MTSLFPGAGTLLNVLTVLLGAGLGMLVGHRLRENTRSVVTDVLGLVTLLVAGLSAMAVTDPELRDAVGAGVPLLVVLGSLLLGSIAGSLLGIEMRLENLAGRIQSFVARRWATEGGTDRADRERFIEGWLTASLLFCVGPLTILGSLNDGLGRGIDQLALKAVLTESSGGWSAEPVGPVSAEADNSHSDCPVRQPCHPGPAVAPQCASR